MKRKNIDTMREVRLWIGQIIVPAVVTVGSVMAIPEVRDAVSVKAKQWKESVEKKIKKVDQKLRFCNGASFLFIFAKFTCPLMKRNSQFIGRTLDLGLEKQVRILYWFFFCFLMYKLKEPYDEDQNAGDEKE